MSYPILHRNWSSENQCYDVTTGVESELRKTNLSCQALDICIISLRLVIILHLFQVEKQGPERVKLSFPGCRWQSLVKLLYVESHLWDILREHRDPERLDGVCWEPFELGQCHLKDHDCNRLYHVSQIVTQGLRLDWLQESYQELLLKTPIPIFFLRCWFGTLEQGLESAFPNTRQTYLIWRPV